MYLVKVILALLMDIANQIPSNFIYNILPKQEMREFSNILLTKIIAHWPIWRKYQ